MAEKINIEILVIISHYSYNYALFDDEYANFLIKVIRLFMKRKIIHKKYMALYRN